MPHPSDPNATDTHRPEPATGVSEGTTDRPAADPDATRPVETETFHPDDRTGPYVPAAPDDTPRRAVRIPGYEVQGVLGRGAMGVVYKARQLKADRLVALKLMLNADHAAPTARERFATEAQAVARMQHPNIVQVFDVGEADGCPFFTLEFVPGGSLDKRVRGQLLTHPEAVAVMTALARAMQYAHDRQIIHRDLKPANILLMPDGTPKVADFGLARKLEADSHLTQAGTVMGTPSYMAPEQAAGDPDAVGPAADVYALGAVLYALLTGRPPFVGATAVETLQQGRTAEPVAPRVLQPRVPKDLETVCLKCLEKEPGKRYASAAALADDLARYRDGRPILARPIGPLARTARWCRRNPAPAALIAVSLLATAITGFAAVRIARQRDEIAAKNELAVGRLEKYRGAVNDLGNVLPGLLENGGVDRLSPGQLAGLVDEFLDTADSLTWNRYRDVPWDHLRPDLLTPDQRSAVAFITYIEDHLPGYFAEYIRHFPVDPAAPADDFPHNRELYRFTVRWAQEEDRHAHALFLYQTKAGLADPDALRSALAVEGRKDFRIPVDLPIQLFAYTLIQEKATQLFYQQFAAAVAEPVLQALLRRMAKDEARHFAFFAGVVEEYARRCGPETVPAVQDMLRAFKMPLADTLRNYWRWSLTVCDAAGGYDHTEAYDSLVRVVGRAADAATGSKVDDLAGFVRNLRRV